MGKRGEGVVVLVGVGKELCSNGSWFNARIVRL